MKIKDKPEYKTKHKPITFRKDDSVWSAIKVMQSKNIGSIIITDSSDIILGIVTERDMLNKVLARKRDPVKTKLQEIMTKNVKAAYENDEVVDWMHIMSKERFRHLPIIDNSGKLINLMSQGDFLAYTWPDLYEKIKKDLKFGLAKFVQYMLLLLTITTIILVSLKL